MHGRIGDQHVSTSIRSACTETARVTIRSIDSGTAVNWLTLSVTYVNIISLTELSIRVISKKYDHIPPYSDPQNNILKICNLNKSLIATFVYKSLNNRLHPPFQLLCTQFDNP